MENQLERAHLTKLMDRERELFRSRHRRSHEVSEEATKHLVTGVPMPWMTRWPGGFPVFFEEAKGARFVDLDGNEFIDFCLGDTGAMTGHALSQITDVITSRAARGITTMLPSTDAVDVGEELSARFGLPKWQFAMTATDANRFVLRYARQLTGRPKIAVIDWCYHGTVDETLVVMDADGNTVSRPGAIGPQIDPALTTRVVPFNDVEALERTLAHGDVACLLMEPALTNIGIVLPEPGYLEQVREITRRHGVYLVIDETHTICAGPGGCTKLWNLQPDFFVIGKPIGGGIPAAVYGMTDEVANLLEPYLRSDGVDVSGVGGTLTGNALALAAVRATLSSTLRQEDFDHMIPLATRWTDGVRAGYEKFGLAWHVQQLGCRAEYWFCPPPRNGADAAAAIDGQIDAYMHLYAMNRGILLTPFHNMALISPFHTAEDIDAHTQVFGDAVRELVTQ